MGKLRYGIIPAAGQGKRMGYLTRLIPKPLLPLYDEAIIFHVLKNMEMMGVEEVFIPVHYHKEVFTKYFEDVQGRLPLTIHVLPLDRPTSGIAGTIETCREAIDDDFVVILGDDCTIAKTFDNLIDSFFRNDALVVEGAVYDDDPRSISSACMIAPGRSGAIADIIEKPTEITSHLRGCGIYIFNRNIFPYIERTQILPPRNEVEITNTIRLAAGEGRAFYETIDGLNININNADDLLRASLIMKSRSN